jgi:hypothetical protein
MPGRELRLVMTEPHINNDPPHRPVSRFDQAEFPLIEMLFALNGRRESLSDGEGKEQETT